MIISFGRQYLFVHIPKTGGTAMALALEDRAKADDILIGDTPKAKRRKRRLKDVQTSGRLWKHSTLRDIDGLLSPAQMDPLFCFTLVRNPWDRVVSYYHWLQDQTFDHPAIGLAQSLPFGAFVAHPHTQASLRAETYGGYLRDVTGQERSALFIRLEHLEDDIKPLEHHLGFALSLPKVNVSRRQRDYCGYYDDDSANLVGRLCAEDIARFSYRF